MINLDISDKISGLTRVKETALTLHGSRACIKMVSSMLNLWMLEARETRFLIEFHFFD